MYVSVPRWRGTSAVSRLRSARQVRGLGFTQAGSATVDPNLTVLPDPFGLYSLTPPRDSSPIVRPDYAAAAGLPYAAPRGAGGDVGFSSWLSDNAGTVGLVSAGVLGLIFVSKAMR